MKRIIVNALLFNLGWLCCVLSSRFGVPLAAIPAVAVIGAVHLLWTTPAQARKREPIAIALVAIVGVAMDTLNLHFGVLGFRGSNTVTPTYVLWMSAFWINFAMTLNVSLAWLRRLLWLAPILGGLSAPGTYAAGAALGALELGEPVRRTLVTIGIEWLLTLPALVLIAARFRPATASPPHGATAPGSTGS